MFKRFIYISLIAGLSFYSCSSQRTVEVSNPNNFDINNQVVEIPLSKLSLKIDTSKEGYLVKDSKGTELASQVTYDGKLLFQVDATANSSQRLSVAKGELKEYATKIFGRNFPERYDDFAWENDKLGFRFYGKALKKIQAPTNGLDLWYKRTTRMVLEDWYKNDISGKASYHVDHGEGCDPYGVGTTLGGGAMAPFVGDSLIRNANFDVAEVLDNGPLRVTAKLTYPKLNFDGKDIEDVRIVSLDAGSHFTKIIQSYGDAKMPVVAGFVKRAKGDSTIVHANNTHLVYVEPISKENGQIYLGLVFPQKIEKTFVNSYQVGKGKFSHVLALAEYVGEPFSYYTGFGWSKSEFATLADFEAYIEKFAQSTQQPLVVKVK